MDEVLLDIRDGVASVTLNRPEAFNAFDEAMIGSLPETLADLASDTGATAVIITGAGKAFCAGGDLKRVRELGLPLGATFHRLAARYHQAVVEIRRMPKPVTAALNGLAAGGGTFTLPRLVGLARAMEIAALDRPIPSNQALEWGLVTEVVGDGKSMERAMELARELCARSGSSFAASKELLNAALESPLECQLERERACLVRCADHPDGLEGISAFVEKRSPCYE